MIFECLCSDGTFQTNAVYYGGKRQGQVSFAIRGSFKRKRYLHHESLIDLSALSLRLGLQTAKRTCILATSGFSRTTVKWRMSIAKAARRPIPDTHRFVGSCGCAR